MNSIRIYLLKSELEHFESLTGRFARLSDLLIQKIFRLIDQLDLEDLGTVRGISIVINIISLLIMMLGGMLILRL